MDPNAISISPIWAGVLLSGGSTAVGVAIWIGRLLFATKAEVAKVEASSKEALAKTEERIQERHEKSADRMWDEMRSMSDFLHRLDKDTVRFHPRSEGGRS